MKQGDLYLDAEQAAKALNVTVATLYAYVSRKMIRSEAIEGSRKRLYWKADIDRLAGQGVAAEVERQQSLPMSESAITLITAKGLFYRGRDAIALADTSSIESLAALLWQADEEALFGAPLSVPPEVWGRLRPALDGLGTYEQAIVSFPTIERLNPQAYDLTPAGYARTSADVLRLYAALVVKSEKPVTRPLHKYMAKALKAPAGFDDVIRRAMVLAADHEFDAMTYAVRAIANVGVTPYQAVTVGLIASQGQRFLLERFGAAVRFLREILAPGGGGAAVIQRLRHGELLPGFTRGGEAADPRGAALMEALKDCLGSDAEFNRLREAEAMVREAAGGVMDFILPATYVGHRLGLHGNELGVVAVGRIVGWVAHAMEQLHSNAPFRPHATYVGQLPRE